MIGKILTVAAVGGLTAFIAGAYFRWEQRRHINPLPYPNKEISGEVDQSRVVYINCSPDKAILVAKSALRTIPKAKDQLVTGRKLEARIGMTFRSFGEKILISAVAARENGAELTIQSKPRFSDTTADFGKNYENVERIVAYLTDRYFVELVSANNSFKPTPLRGAA